MPINRKIGVNLAFTADTKQAQAQLNNLQNTLTQLVNTAPTQGFSGFTKELQQASTAAATLKVQLSDATNVNTGKLDLGKFNQSLKTSGMTLEMYKNQLANLGPQGVAAFGQLSQAIMSAEMPLRRSSQLLTDFATTLKNTARWQISSSLLHGFMGSVQSAYYYAQDLNESLNNIRIVTGKSVDEMSDFAKEANSAAQALNTTTTAYTDASLIYYQQGLSDEEVKERTDVTIKMANVARESAIEVSEQMTAIWNNFAKGGDNLEYYSDVITALGAATASSSAEIAEGLEKFAAVADTVGLSYEYATSALATVTATTRQSADIVGNAFKTLFSRIQGLKLGETLDDGTDLNKYSAALEAVGVNIKGVDGELKDMDIILDELGNKWQTLGKDQKMALAQTVAGVRQYTQLIALMDNWDFFQENLGTAKNSEGTLQKQADTYAESWDAAQKRVKAAAEQIYDDLLNDKFFIDLNNSLAKTLNFIDQLIKGFGGVQSILLGVGSLIFKLFGNQLSESINNTIYSLQMMTSAGKEAAQQTKNEVNELLQSFYTSSKNPYDKMVGEAYASQGKAQEEFIKQAERLDETQRKIAATLLDQHKILVDNVVQQAELTKETEKQFRLTMSRANTVGMAGVKDENKAGAQKVLNQTAVLAKRQARFSAVEQGLFGGISAESFEGTSKEITTLKTNIESVIQQYGKLNASVEENTQLLSSEEGFTTNQAAAFVRLYDSLKNVDAEASLTDEEFKAIQGALSQLAIEQQKVEDGSSSLGKKVTALVQQYGMEKEEVEGVIVAAQNLGNKEGELFVAQHNLSENTNDFAQKLSTLIATMQNAGEVVVKFAQATTNAAMTATMVSSAINTWGDSSASLAQKLTSLGMATTKLSTSIVTGIKGIIEAKKAGDSLALATNVYMIALTAIITILQVVINKINEKREALLESNKAIIDAANADREAARANEELYESFTDLYSKYKEGVDVKEDLYETTKQLIEAYDLESSRLDLLTGKYNEVAAAAANKRKEAQAEILEEDKKAIKAASENVVEQGRTAFDSGIHGGQYRVRLSGNSIIKGEGDYDQAMAAAKEIFGEAAISANEFAFTLNDLKFDPKNTKEVADFTAKLEQFSDVLEKAGYEGSYFYNNLNEKIDAFNKDGALDTLKELQKETLNDVLNNSSLDLAKTQEDFDAEIEEVKKSINKQIEEGNIAGDVDPEKEIADYISTLNSEFSKKFTIEQGLVEKFGDTLNNSLVQEFEKLSNDTQLKIVDLFDFSMDEEKGKELLQKYQQYFESQSSVFGAIPVSFQDQLNDSILKGKDISKGDWETLLSSSPSAESILGDKDSFNNKSIGERISLMQQLNEVIKESNSLAIKEYEQNKANSEEIINDLQNQKEAYIQEIDVLEKRIREESYLSEEERENVKNRIKDIQTEIENLTNQQYEIEISLNMDEVTDNLVQGIVGDVMTSADQIKAATEAIGEGWTVAAEDVATFAAAFPELMEGMERLEDGSLQLDKDIVNTAIESAQERIKANKTVAIQAAEDKIKQLKLELKFKEQQAQILDEALAGEKNAAETKAALADALKTYKDDLLDAGLISETDAINQAVNIEAQGVTNMISVLDTLNEAINTIHSNFAKMLDPEASINDLKTKAAMAGQVAQSAGIDRSKLYQNAFDDSSIDAMIEARQKLSGEISSIKTDIASYEGFVSEMANSVTEMDAAAERVKAGKAGKESKESKSGGSSKKDKERDKEQKRLEDEFDRYWELKKAIDAVDKAISRLEKDQQNLYGYELINSLKEENKLLEQQKGHYEALAEAQRQEAAELQGVLAGQGVAFDASGAITNYAAATSAALAQYNDAIAQYNAGLLDESALKVYERNYEAFKKALERYDTLFYNEMKDTQDKLDDLWRKELANNLKAWEVEVKLKLDKKELKRGWNDFLKEINEDFKKVYKDLEVDLKNLKKNAKTYVGDDGTINTIIKAVHDVTAEIDKMRSGGSSDMFESISQAQEKLKELNEQLQQAGRELNDLRKEAYELYLSELDQIESMFDMIQKDFDHVDKQMSFLKQSYELIYGSKNYEKMDEYYEAQDKINNDQIEAAKAQYDFYTRAVEKSGQMSRDVSTWTQDEIKNYNDMLDAQSALYDKTLAGFQLAHEMAEYQKDKIIHQTEMEMTGGRGLDGIRSSWEKAKQESELYLDNVEKIADAQKLVNQAEGMLGSTTDAKSQAKLQKFLNEEVKALKEKEKVSKYEVQAAQDRLDIIQKEIALREAQENKTSMKLTRKEQGNWTYQYIADEEDVNSKQQDLLDSLSKFREDAIAAEKELEELALTTTERFFEEWNQLEELRLKGEISLDEYQRRRDELEKNHSEVMSYVAEQSEIVKRDAALGTAGVLSELYRQDPINYEVMTDTEKGLLDELKAHGVTDFQGLEDAFNNNSTNIATITTTLMGELDKSWTNEATALIKKWAADDGKSVKANLSKAMSDLEKVYNGMDERINTKIDKSGINFDEEMKNAILKTEDLKKTMDTFIDTEEPKLDNMRKLIENIEKAWDKVKRPIENAIDTIKKYLDYVGDTKRAMDELTAASIQAANAIATAKAAEASGGGGGGGSTGGSPSGQATPEYYVASQGEGRKWQYKIVYSDGTESDWLDQKPTGIPQQNTQGATYATGGYTGEWNNGSTDGRLAYLHQKELVLNESDTSNFLEGINTIRDMSSLNGSISKAIVSSVANMVLALSKHDINVPAGANSESTSAGDVFNITAEFPNANDVNEIRQAILSLPNLASQYMAQNGK